MRRGLDKTFNIGIVGLLLAAAIATLAPAARAVPVPITARETAHPTIAAPRIRPTHFAQDACGLIETESALRNIPAPFIARLIWTESRFNPVAVSPKGAQGIAQFMPGTAAAYGLDDPFDAPAAIDAQAHLMSDLLRQLRSVPLALAAYNAGPGAVAACMCIPPYPETRAYVARILALLDGAGGLLAPPLEVRLVR